MSAVVSREPGLYSLFPCLLGAPVRSFVLHSLCARPFLGEYCEVMFYTCRRELACRSSHRGCVCLLLVLFPLCCFSGRGLQSWLGGLRSSAPDVSYVIDVNMTDVVLSRLGYRSNRAWSKKKNWMKDMENLKALNCLTFAHQLHTTQER